MAPSAHGPSEIEVAFREVYGRAVATLTGLFGDVEAAEDSVQEAFAIASQRWPEHGIPPNPAGWIVTTARNRQIDSARRSSRGQELHEQAAREAPTADHWSEQGDEASMNDDQLRLIFTCCHPALRVDSRVALTLRLVGGLTIAEIASGLLVSEAALAKRLTRAKHKIRAATIPFRIPAEADLAGRVRAVLTVLYLIYNAGAQDRGGRGSLRSEAIRRTRSLRELLPNDPEVAGLLALLLLNESRVAAREVGGSLVLLRDQDRARWHAGLIDEGHRLVRDCIELDSPGPFQLQAAIQAVHCDAPTFDVTDWAQIVSLYDHLYQLMPTPVVALNRAIAIGEVDGAEAGLTQVDSLCDVLAGYQPFHAARAAMLQTLGRDAQADHEFRRAATLAVSGAERSYLISQISDDDELESHGTLR